MTVEDIQARLAAKRNGPEWKALKAAVRGNVFKRYQEHRQAVLRGRTAGRKRYYLAHPVQVREHGLRFDKRTGFWKVRVVPQQDGKNAAWVSTGATTVREALKAVDAAGVQQLSMLARARCLTADTINILSVGHRTTCGAIIKAWRLTLKEDMARRTAMSYSSQMRQLVRRLGCANQPATWITREHLNQYVNEPGTSEALRSQRLKALRSFYRHAAGFGHVIGNLSETIKINARTLTVNQREAIPANPFTEEEYRRIMSNVDVPQFWRWATALGWWMGLRMVDVCNLQWASLKGCFVVLYPHKTGRRLLLPLSDPLIGGGELEEVFDEMWNTIKDKGDYCFPDRQRYYPGLFENNVFLQYKQVLKTCGIEGKTFHGLRHSFRLRMTHSGKPIEEVSKLMGHANIKTTLDYGRSVEGVA